MSSLPNIVIADESAAHLLLHSAGIAALGARRVYDNPLLNGARFPEETRMAIQSCFPLRYRGFALPFSAMNFDIKAHRSVSILEHSDYSLDLVDIDRRIGLKYDGSEYHPDPSADKRRRNSLLALGWRMFPIDSSVLYNPGATEKAAYQLAKIINLRIRKPKDRDLLSAMGTLNRP